jgi:hypothetical protein
MPTKAKLVMSTLAPTHPIRPALAELAAFAAGIAPHRISTNSPSQDDANALVEELHLFCTKVDRVVEAYGEYAAAHFHGIEMALFKNQLAEALEGNALYVLTSAGEAVNEDRREYEAEPRWWNR